MSSTNKISSLNLDNKIQEPRPIGDPRKYLSNIPTQVKAMETIVGMMRQDYVSNILLVGNLKIVDTNNYEMWLCAIFIWKMRALTCLLAR